MSGSESYRIEILKMLFGYALLINIAALVAMIALGRVEEKTSFKLQSMETGLLMLASAWGQHMLSGRKNNTDDKEN